jgi:hypothetical protein
MWEDMSDGISGDAIACASEIIQSYRLKTLLHHWSTARRGRLVPGWHDLDPTEMPSVLSIIWCWKYDPAEGSFIGRIAGEEIRAIWGKPIANMPMQSYFEGWNYDHILRRHKKIVGDAMIGVERGVVFQHNDRHGFGERLMLPLSSDGIHSDGIIGATTYRLHPADFDPAIDVLSAYRKYRSTISGTSERYFKLDHTSPEAINPAQIDPAIDADAVLACAS